MSEKREITTHEQALEAVAILRTALEAYTDMYNDLRSLIVAEIEPMTKEDDDLTPIEEAKIELLKKVVEIMKTAQGKMETSE